MRIHSDEAMEGRIFIGFISLIITSYIREKMRVQDIYRKYSFHELMAELKKLKMIVFKDGKKLLTEITSRQKFIFKAMELEIPTST